MTSTRRFIDVAALADLPTSSGLRILHNGREIALFRDGDAVVAFDGTCPHRGAPLGDARVEDRTFSCPMHGWRFSLPEGACLDHPDRTLQPIPVRIVGPRIQIAL